MQPVIHWFRRDLRLIDNIALDLAAAAGRPVIPVYVVDSQDAGGASRWWLHHSLAGIVRELRAGGSSVGLRCGAPEPVLADLAAGSGGVGGCV